MVEPLIWTKINTEEPADCEKIRIPSLFLASDSVWFVSVNANANANGNRMRIEG